MPRRKNPNPPWKDWETARAKCLQELGEPLFRAAEGIFLGEELYVRGQAEAATWDEQIENLRRVSSLLDLLDKGLARSNAFIEQPQGLEILESLKAAKNNPLLAAIAETRERRPRDSLPLGQSPGRIRDRLCSNLGIARTAINEIRELARGIAGGLKVLESTRTSVIADQLVQLEENRRRTRQLHTPEFRFAGADVALLDLIARKAALEDETAWSNLRLQWHMALDRARERSTANSQ